MNRAKTKSGRKQKGGRYTRCLAIQKHPIRLLIEKFVTMLNATYANRLRKIGLKVGRDD